MILPELERLLQKIPQKEQRALYEKLLKEPIKRSSIRRTVSQEIGYIVDGKEYIDVLRDLSFDGAFIETTNRFTIGQAIQMEIPWANSAKVIRATGVIVRIALDGVGVKFTKEKKFNP